MRDRFSSFFKILGLALPFFGATIDSGQAADLGIVPLAGAAAGCSDIRLVCENGRTAQLCPIALSVAGDVVTATLRFHPGGASYVRLVPMGVGYRYAGRGVWLDGLRNDAILNVGNQAAVACTVEGAVNYYRYWW